MNLEQLHTLILTKVRVSSSAWQGWKIFSIPELAREFSMDCDMVAAIIVDLHRKREIELHCRTTPPLLADLITNPVAMRAAEKQATIDDRSCSKSS